MKRTTLVEEVENFTFVLGRSFGTAHEMVPPQMSFKFSFKKTSNARSQRYNQLILLIEQNSTLIFESFCVILVLGLIRPKKHKIW